MRLGILGAGNLARALVLGLGDPVAVYDPVAERAAALASATGGTAHDSPAALVDACDAVVLCHKPAQLQEVSEQLAGGASRVISMLGATPLSALRGAYPAAAVVRVMPNIAMEIGQGFSIVCSGSGAAEQALAEDVRLLLERVGAVAQLDESMLPLAQGTSGGMPAYIALIIEAYVDALVRQGMPQETALEVVAGSIPGAAALVAARSGDTLGVRRQVTSPGGTTARAIRALDAGGLREAIAAAVDASILR